MKRHAVTAVLAALVLFTGTMVASVALDRVYLPYVRGQTIRLTGQVFPPAGLHCLLQQGTSRVIDPRTDTEVFSCEATNNHGQIVFTTDTLLLDHVAVGSGSLSVTDGRVYITAVNEDGSIVVQEVPTP